MVRVKLEATVVVYWSRQVVSVSFDGVWPPVPGASMIRLIFPPVMSSTAIAFTVMVTVWDAVSVWAEARTAENRIRVAARKSDLHFLMVSLFFTDNISSIGRILDAVWHPVNRFRR
jgi:hypothetical protein